MIHWRAVCVQSLRPLILLASWIIIRRRIIRRRDLVIIHAGVRNHMNIIVWAATTEDLAIILMLWVRTAVAGALLAKS